jgi:shikimate dehydrogenase
MHNAAFRVLGLDAVYVPLACAASHVPTLMAALAAAGGGGNVTVPHKQVAAGALAKPSERVVSLGACNTFWWDGSGLTGESTDVEGVQAAVRRLEVEADVWFVVGTGGSARAVA